MCKICPKCKSIAEYNAYYGRNTCTRCNYEWNDAEDELLFKFDGGFLHIQRTLDDFDVDYTIYDSLFNAKDGGVLCSNGETLKEIAEAILRVEGLYNNVSLIDIEEHRDKF